MSAPMRADALWARIKKIHDSGNMCFVMRLARDLLYPVATGIVPD
jgi:hypothetical protein